LDTQTANELVTILASEDFNKVVPIPQDEAVELMTEARKKHLVSVSSIVPGFTAFELDTDVRLLLWGKTMHKGAYHILVPESYDHIEPQHTWIWTLELDEDSVAADLERAKAEGRLEDHVDEDGNEYTAVRGSGSFRINMNPILLDDGVNARLEDLFLWLAVDDLIQEGGDTQKAVRLIRAAYKRRSPAQEPPTLEAIAPENRIVPNSKVTQVLRQGKAPLLFEQGGRNLKVDEKNRQIQFALWQDEEAAIEVSDTIDAEDVTVIEAVSTLKHAGNTVITPGQIVKHMGYGRPTPELVEEVHGRVLRLMSIKGRIDWTQQAKAWNLKNPDTGEPYEHAEIVGNLLSMTVFDGTDVKGNRDIRYKVASDPITYEHARLVHQVIDYPTELLDLVPIDEDNNEVKRVNRDQKKLERAVLWYVFSLKNPRCKMSNYVTYEALFDYAGVTIGSSSSRKRAVKFVQAYLKALQRAGVIYAFTPKIEQSRRHLQTGVSIFVEKPGRGKARRS